MGYSRIDIVRPEQVDNDLWQNRNQRGYTHKLCPWSIEYREKFKYEGSIIVYWNGNQPVYQEGIWVVGNSVDESFKKDWGTYECSNHTTTSGRMEYNQNPPGWICRDPNCYYHTTVASGERYREV